MTSYLRLAGQGQKILAFRADEYYWRDLGKVESVKKAEEESGAAGESGSMRGCEKQLSSGMKNTLRVAGAALMGWLAHHGRRPHQSRGFLSDWSWKWVVAMFVVFG